MTKAVAHENRETYLPKEMFSAAIKELFMLKIKTADLGGALALYERMDKNLKKDTDLTELTMEIKELQTGDRTFSTKGKIKKSNTWSVALLKRKFNVALTSGALAEIVLRCFAGYRLYNFEAGTVYEIPENYGDCTAELIGDEGSQFSFTQL